VLIANIVPVLVGISIRCVCCGGYAISKLYAKYQPLEAELVDGDQSSSNDNHSQQQFAAFSVGFPQQISYPVNDCRYPQSALLYISPGLFHSTAFLKKHLSQKKHFLQMFHVCEKNDFSRFIPIWFK
jgi:hypothetical protein